MADANGHLGYCSDGCLAGRRKRWCCSMVLKQALGLVGRWGAYQGSSNSWMWMHTCCSLLRRKRCGVPAEHRTALHGWRERQGRAPAPRPVQAGACDACGGAGLHPGAVLPAGRRVRRSGRFLRRWKAADVKNASWSSGVPSQLLPPMHHLCKRQRSQKTLSGKRFLDLPCRHIATCPVASRPITCHIPVVLRCTLNDTIAVVTCSVVELPMPTFTW